MKKLIMTSKEDNFDSTLHHACQIAVSRITSNSIDAGIFFRSLCKVCWIFSLSCCGRACFRAQHFLICIPCLQGQRWKQSYATFTPYLSPPSTLLSLFSLLYSIQIFRPLSFIRAQCQRRHLLQLFPRSVEISPFLGPRRCHEPHQSFCTTLY